MMGRGVIVAALATYLVVVGCVMWPAPPAQHGAEAVASEAPGADAEPDSAEPDSFVEPSTTQGPTPTAIAQARPQPQPAPPRPTADRPRASGFPYCGVA